MKKKHKMLNVIQYFNDHLMRKIKEIKKTCRRLLIA